MDLKYVVVACIVLVCNLKAVFGQSLERGVAFPEDVLIGADKMFTTGGITQVNWAYRYLRNVTLIPVQGRIQYSEVGTGYLIGFQFYNRESSYREYTSLNIHVYRKTDPADAYTDFAGDYTLIEDLYYSTEPGFNVVYFQKAVHVSESVNEDLYIGFLSDYSGKTPILFDSAGCDGPEVYLKSREFTSGNHVNVGDTLRFDASDPPNQCQKYSFQAIFAPSPLASVNHGNCSLTVLIEDRARYIEFNEYYVDYYFANYSGTACYIIRADRRDRGIILVENSFHMGEDNRGCENSASHLQIYEGNRLTADSAGIADGKLWNPNFYCGYDIFNEKYTTFPYLRLTVSAPQDQLADQSFYFAVYIRIEDHAKLKIGLSVAFVILTVIGLILLVLVCTRKGNKTVSGSNAGSQAQPLVHTHGQPAGGAMYIASNPQPSSSMQSQPTTQPVHPANQEPYSTYQGLANQPQASNTGQYSTLQNDGDGMGPNPSAPRNSDLYSEVDHKTML